ncbi:MAG: hypothetical protein ABI780_12665 [Ardenticatenales bacterium]
MRTPLSLTISLTVTLSVTLALALALALVTAHLAAPPRLVSAAPLRQPPTSTIAIPSPTATPMPGPSPTATPRPRHRALLPLSLAAVRLDRLPPAPTAAATTPRPTRTATALPTPYLTPTPCPLPWRLTVRIIAEGGPDDMPCDGLPEHGDPSALSICGLPTVHVEVRDRPLGRFNSSTLLWEGDVVAASAAAFAERTIELCVPPPYAVTVRADGAAAAMPSVCTRWCVHTPPTRLMSQDDFDRGDPSAPAGAGHAALARWSLDRSMQHAASQGAPLAYLPALDAVQPAPGCLPRVVVQNVGDEAGRAAIVVLGNSDACDEAHGPLRVECSGVIKPGSTWTFAASWALPADTTSGYVVSFSARQFYQAGIDVGLDDSIADYMCALLRFKITGDASEEARFRHAFISASDEVGAEYEGIPLVRTYGPPIAVTVERACPSGDPAAPSTSDSAVYVAPSAADLDVAEFHGNFYRYPLPAIAAHGRRTTIVHVQNADVGCRPVRVFRLDPRGNQWQCEEFTLSPGESRAFDLGDCSPATPAGPDGVAPTAGWVEGDGPLAVVADIAGVAAGWPVLASYTAPSPAQPPALGAGVGTILMAPLAFEPSADGRNGAEIYVQNVSGELTATVRARFLTRDGDPSPLPDRTAVLGPLGHVMFTIASPAGKAAETASVRVDSLTPASSDDPNALDVPPAPIAAVVVQGRTTGGAYAPATSPMTWSAADTFAAVLDPSAATPADAVRTARLALPSVAREKGPTKDAPGRETRIALQNRIEKPGFTDIVLYFYDQNGLLDYICQKLNERQVEYIDLNDWGYISPGFRGSVLVSATFWQHDLYDKDGQFVANLVDLAAAYGDSGPGPDDGRTWTSGVPFSNDFALGAVPAPLCGGFASMRAPVVGR